MLVRPEVLRQLLLLQPFQQRVQRPSLDARETVLAKGLGNGVPVILPVTQHCKHRLRERGPRQFWIVVEIFHP